MLRLKALGALDLREDGRPPLREALAQPKRIALLAYLALHNGAYVRRDTILALLWPELDTERARHSLRQALYLLRRWLSTDVILKRGEEELAVDPNQLWCDAGAFQALLKEGKNDDALTLYGGDFLAGFHVPDASDEFEDWIVRVRQECRGQAIRAAMAVVKEAKASGHQDRALEVIRWAAAVDPLDEGIQIALITLLGTRGDAIGARRAYKSFADRLERELGAAPSAASAQALAEAEQARPAVVAAAAELPRTPPLTATTDPQARAHPDARNRTGMILGGVLALGLMLAAFLLNRRPEPSSSTPVLAVAPIHQVPARRDSTEALPIADLLATSLARLPAMQVLSNARLIEIEQALTRNGTPPPATEIARRAQATELLEGTVYRIGTDSMVLELQRVDVRSGKVLHGYRVGASDVFTLVDRATAEIARAADVARPAEGIADVTTRSLVAFRFYQEGLRSFYNNDVSAARQLFRSAVAEDSTFAMAMWYLGRTDAVTDDPAGWDHYASALRLAAGASDRERWLITAAYLIADSRATAKIVAESLTTRFPSDPDGLWLLGVAASTAADYELGAVTLRRAIAVDSTLEVRAGPACRLCDANEALVYLYLSADSIETARAVAEEGVRRVPGSARAWSTLAHVAWAQDDSMRAYAAEAAVGKLVPNLGPTGIRAAVLRPLWRGGYEQALEQLISLGGLHPGLRPDARWYAVIALRNLGRLREALDVSLGRVPGNEPAAVLNVAVDSVLPMLVRFEQGDPRPCVALFGRPGRGRDASFRRQWPGHAAREEAWEWVRLAMCRAELPDSGSLAAIADTLQKLGAQSGNGRNQRLHHYVRGLLWKARRNEEEAVAEFRLAISSPNLGFTRINYELGKTLLSLRRPVEAVAILQPALRGEVDASNLYVTRTEIHELLAMAWERAGGADSARAHWGAVEGAWRHADPQFRARYEFARARLATGAGR